MSLEEKLKCIYKKTGEFSLSSFEHVVRLYNEAYENCPIITSCLSAMVGTVGGDAIAKRFAEGENVELRDLAFTAAASLVQAYYYPKLIPLAERIAKIPKVKKVFEKIGLNEQWTKAIVLTGLFFPINMLYWNYLSVKNKTSINVANNLQGAKTIAEASIPYLGVDYVVTNKLDKKYALPTWSAAELGWNTYVALKNYLVGRLLGN